MFVNAFMGYTYTADKKIKTQNEMNGNIANKKTAH